MTSRSERTAAVVALGLAAPMRSLFRKWDLVISFTTRTDSAK